MEDKEKKFGIEMMESLHREVKAESARRGMKLKQATAQAFGAWLGRDSQRRSDRAPSPPPNEEEQRYTTALLEMLRAGDEVLWPVVKHNLEMWAKHHSSARKRKLA